MAAAPGGKSCFIGERMKGEGLLYANDVSQKRLRSLFFNLTRHRINNAVVLNLDGREVTNINPDRILLDAPCTGTGLLVSKPHIKTSKKIDDSIQLQRIQIQMLQRAYSLLESGGVCVYSTCAISQIENEMVVETFSSKFEVINPEITGGDGILNGIVYGKRYYPHLQKCDGFFISKLVKV
jgi:ribosomal RNA methyltransferase Nop2